MIKEKKVKKEKEKAQPEYDYSFKLLTVGCSLVGKTSILLRITENLFYSNNMTTIGVDLKVKDFVVNDKKVQLKFWDTAGQEKFGNITSQYYKNSNGIFLVFDVNDRDSFNKVSEWMEEIKGKKGKAMILLVANKIDTDKREVLREEGQASADKYGIPYYEASAKTGYNIQEMVEDFVKKLMIEEDKERKNKNEENLSVYLSKSNNNQKGCCS